MKSFEAVIDTAVTTTPDSTTQAPSIGTIVGEAIGSMSTKQKVVTGVVVGGTVGAVGALSYWLGSRNTVAAATKAFASDIKAAATS